MGVGEAVADIGVLLRRDLSLVRPVGEGAASKAAVIAYKDRRTAVLVQRGAAISTSTSGKRYGVGMIGDRDIARRQRLRTGSPLTAIGWVLLVAGIGSTLAVMAIGLWKLHV